MDVINVRNVGEALPLGLRIISEHGVRRDSRNGSVLTMPMPVATVYQKPEERVMFIPERDANPFFHLMESLWMMAGRNDVAWLSQFNSNIANYSDDGVHFHGAYGYRWRNMNADGGVLDQLETIANLLKQNPDDRRVVLQMWDSSIDLGMEGKDFPCNLTVTFRVNPYGQLDMTVFNRSNDMVWGAYGANAVHFSFLQEVMAAWIGVPIGRYWQISTNLHLYLNHAFEKVKPLLDQKYKMTPYEIGEVTPYPVVNTDIEVWMEDLNMFMEVGPVMGFRDPFFKKVVVPMFQAWQAWKNKDDPQRIENALMFARQIMATDWQKACVEWLERRQ